MACHAYVLCEAVVKTVKVITTSAGEILQLDSIYKNNLKCHIGTYVLGVTVDELLVKSGPASVVGLVMKTMLPRTGKVVTHPLEGGGSMASRRSASGTASVLLYHQHRNDIRVSRARSTAL